MIGVAGMENAPPALVTVGREQPVAAKNGVQMRGHALV